MVTLPLTTTSTLPMSEKKSSLASKSTGSACFTVTTGSENKGDDDSLFGERKKSEVLYTSFNDLIQQEKKAPSPVAVKPSFDQEKIIQEASQQILSPTHKVDPAEAGNKLLDSLLAQTKSSGLGLSMLSCGSTKKTERLKLDFSDEENKSLTTLDDDVKEREGKKTNTKPKTARKKTRSRRKS